MQDWYENQYEPQWVPEPMFSQGHGEMMLPSDNGPDLSAARKSFSRIGLGIFSMMILANLLSVIISLVLPERVSSWVSWILTALPMYGVAMPTAYLVVQGMPCESTGGSKLRFGQLCILFLICETMMYGGNLIGGLISAFFGQILGRSALNPVESIILGDELLPMALVTVILAPVFEEWIFRKTLIDRMRRYGEKTAVVTSAVIFGLIHGNLSQMFYACGVGLVFGYIYLRTERISYTIGLHMVLNFLGSVIPALFLRGGAQDLLTSQSIGLENLSVSLVLYMLYVFIIFGVSIAGLVLMICRLSRVHFARASQGLPKGTRFRTVFLNVGMILLVIICLASAALMFFVT